MANTNLPTLGHRINAFYKGSVEPWLTNPKAAGRIVAYRMLDGVPRDIIRNRCMSQAIDNVRLYYESNEELRNRSEDSKDHYAYNDHQARNRAFYNALREMRVERVRKNDLPPRTSTRSFESNFEFNDERELQFYLTFKTEQESVSKHR